MRCPRETSPQPGTPVSPAGPAPRRRAGARPASSAGSTAGPARRTLVAASFPFLVAASTGCLLFAARPAAAVIPPELPMVQRLGSGVRSLGMGGASVALSDDASGLASNPAGLAGVRRVLFSGSIQSRSLDTRTSFGGFEESTPFDKSRIHAVGFVYPFPTWRGSLVVGFSFNREAELDAEYLRSGEVPEVLQEEESILEEGSLGAWRAGVAVDLGPNLSLGAAGTILAGSSHRERDFRYDDLSGSDYEVTSSVVDLDLLAVSGTLGAVYRTENGLRLGLALHLPEEYDLDGDATDDVRHYHAGRDTLDFLDRYRFEDRVQLPFRTSVGLAYSPQVGRNDLVLSAQWDYADWQQIDYDGPIRTDDRRYAYRSTHDLRFGAEYRFAAVPFTLRAGYIRQPVAFSVVGTDVFLEEARSARFDPDRAYFTLGAGFELDPTFRLDAAFAAGRFTRSARSTRRIVTEEEFKDRRLVLGATFQL